MSRLSKELEAIEKLKSDLLGKNKPMKTKKKLLSTGSTLLNLALSGKRKGGIEEGTLVLLAGDSDSGKAQPLSSRVLTPRGWVKMGDLRIGQKVVDPDGSVGRVEAIYPQGTQDTYLVSFSDGTSTRTTTDHLWLTSTLNDRKYGKTRIVDTAEIARTNGQGAYIYTIPTTQPVAFKSKGKPPIHPYILGCLLGDGCFRLQGAVLLSAAEKEIVLKIRDLLPEGHFLIHRSGYDYAITSNLGQGGGKYSQTPNQVLEGVRSLGLGGRGSSDKFIPLLYRRSSIKNRILLLQGLMDTDGYIDKNGKMQITTASKKMAEGVADLVRSLGGRAIIHHNPNHRPSYTHNGEKRYGKSPYEVYLAFPPSVIPFSLGRKLVRMKPRQEKFDKRIVSVVKDTPEECQCIRVSTKRNLYITDGYVVTHNTYIARTILAEAANNPAFDGYDLKYSDAERGWLGDDVLHFGKKLTSRLQTDYPDSLDEFYYTVDDDIQSNRPFIRVLDSMDALQPKDDLKKFRKQKAAARADKEEKGTYGMAKAKMNSDKLRIVADRVAQTGSILIIIAQLKDNVASPIPGQKSVSGGKALKFYSHLIVWTGTKSVIMGEYKAGKKLDQGIQVIAKVKRTRLTGKKRAVTFPIYHTAGIDDVGSCIDFLVEHGHWKKQGGKIDAEEFLEEQRGMKREALVHYIEEGNHEEQLQTLVASVWRDIEDKIAIHRKKRYE